MRRRHARKVNELLTELTRSQDRERLLYRQVRLREQSDDALRFRVAAIADEVDGDYYTGPVGELLTAALRETCLHKYVADAANPIQPVCIRCGERGSDGAGG